MGTIGGARTAYPSGAQREILQIVKTAAFLLQKLTLSNNSTPILIKLSSQILNTCIPNG
jgi:hypothetical protein